MNTKAVVLALFVANTLSNVPVEAYELTAHAAMSRKAVDKSVMSDPIFLDRLGIFRSRNALGGTYFDLADAGGASVTIQPRIANRFEVGKFPVVSPEVVPNGTTGWLMRGAVREDDGAFLLNAKGEPLDDPYGNIYRFCNHFFDPLNVRALTGFCVNSTLDMAPNWAIGTTNAFASPVERAGFYRNHFTVFAARETMWRALTLRDKNGLSISQAANSVEREAERLAYWATTFRSIGNVVHLLQDTAQPQHTRNEGHASDNVAIIEKYADARAGTPIQGQPATSFRIDGLTLARSDGALRPLDYELKDNVGNLVAYPIPRFNSYTDYWSTSRGDTPPRREGSITSGKGIADYSSRGFLTIGSSLTGASFSEFPSPPRLSSDSSYTLSLPVDLCDAPGPQPIKTQYLLRDVIDSAAPLTTGKVRLQSKGLWGISGTGNFTLNHCVMDDNLRVLIPRAVAYSAGLIDYFFRGRLEITPPAEGIYSLVDHADFSGANVTTPTAAETGFKGFKTIKLQLKNTTPAIVPSGGGATVVQDMTGGTLVAVLKFYRNKNYTDNLVGEPSSVATYNSSRSLAEEIVVSSRVKDGSGMPFPALVPVTNSAQTYIFEFDQELPINAMDVKLQVVYRGPLGSEADAVVVETVDISEPSYFTYMNASDYIAVGNSIYTRSQINTSAELRSQIRPTSCIDSMTSQLLETCFPITPLNFTMTFGNNNNARAGGSLPNVRQYHRVAMLTPADSPATVGLINATCNNGGTFSLPGRTLQRNYVALPTGGVGDETIAMPMAIPPARGVPFWKGVICIHDGDQSNFASLSASWWSPMSTNIDSTRFPKPADNFKFGAP